MYISKLISDSGKKVTCRILNLTHLAALAQGSLKGQMRGDTKQRKRPPQEAEDRSGLESRPMGQRMSEALFKEEGCTHALRLLLSRTWLQDNVTRFCLDAATELSAAKCLIVAFTAWTYAC